MGTNAIFILVIIVYIIFHAPAIILLFLGLKNLKKKPERAKTQLIIAGIYFLIGGGICGTLLNL
ncbi:MAG: hypothetical protein PHV20_10045 [Bacteroidales bacterium]|nr:hypothetical protein [Bacteroidales bacterium]